MLKGFIKRVQASTIGVILAAVLFVVVPVGLMGVAVTGYQDLQVISTPGNPASGYVRWFATSAGLGCLTSSGANCLGTQTIASGTATLGTSGISSGACASVVTVSATGVATTDNIMADFNASPTSTTGYSPSGSGMLTIIKYPTSGDVNFVVCNNTASSVTPGAVTLNWRVTR